MRITTGDGSVLSDVYSALTHDETRELPDDLTELLTAKKGWHAHTSDAELQTTVTVYREDETAVF